MTTRGPVTITITFGPTRSLMLPDVLVHAREWGELERVREGRWRVRLLLATDPRQYSRAERLVLQTRAWKATEVDVDGDPENVFRILEMLSSARRNLRLYGRCGFSYFGTIPERCALCPLYDRGRALRELAENARGLGPASIDVDPLGNLEVPDQVPPEWTDPDD